MVRTFALLFLLLAWLVTVSCASASSVLRRDRFPLDPREELTGPFPEGVERGWAALRKGDVRRAAEAFASARSGAPAAAADIGWIEALVLSGRGEEASSACEDLLAEGEPTLSLLVACGEAWARAGDAPRGYALYRQALARTASRPGIEQRAEELRLGSREVLLSRSEARAKEKDWEEARREILRAIEVAPESAGVRAAAGDIESAAGDREMALRRYREALEIESKDPSLLEKAGELGLELKEYALAVSVFDELAKSDERFRPRAAEARMAFRVANWPAPEREAAQSVRLTRAGAAELVWWMFSEVREARVAASVIASDAVSRRDSRAVTRALSLGLLEVDRETHRANPDAPLTLSAASRLLLRLLAMVSPPAHDLPCLEGRARPLRANGEAVRTAENCGLLADSNSPAVSGLAFTRALDRVRALASSVGQAAP